MNKILYVPLVMEVEKQETVHHWNVTLVRELESSLIRFSRGNKDAILAKVLEH